MKHTDGCIICGKPRPSVINASHYCSSCRGVVANIRKVVARAMADGDIPRPSGQCVDCGQPATCYDHRYYSLPFEVDPVCSRCNTNRGPAVDVAELGRAALGLGEAVTRHDVAPVSLTEKLRTAEKHAIQSALKVHNHNMAAAARALGVKYRSIRYRMDKLGIS